MSFRNPLVNPGDLRDANEDPLRLPGDLTVNDPATPQGFTITSTPSGTRSRSCTVRWDIVPGAVAYNIYRDNVILLLEQPPSQIYGGYYSSLRSNMMPGETYIYSITSIDSNGEESEPASFQYTCPPVGDTWIGSFIRNAFLIKFPDYPAGAITQAAAQAIVDDWIAQLAEESYGQHVMTSTVYDYITLPYPLTGGARYGGFLSPSTGLWVGVNDQTVIYDARLAIRAAYGDSVLEEISTLPWYFVDTVAASGYGPYVGTQASNGLINSEKDVLMHEHGHLITISGHADHLAADPGGGDVYPDLTDFYAPNVGGYGGYGDPYCHMGVQIPKASDTGRYSTCIRNIMGWIPAARVLTVTTTGVYTLQDAGDNSGADPLEIRIPFGFEFGSTVKGFFYTIEYRPDAAVAGCLVRIHSGHAAFGNCETWLVNHGGGSAPGILTVAGPVVDDTYRGVHIEVTAVAAGPPKTAEVTITIT